MAIYWQQINQIKTNFFFLFTSQIIPMKKRIQSPQHARSVIKTVSHLTRVDIIESSEVYYSLMQEAGATAKDYELVSNLLDQ